MRTPAPRPGRGQPTRERLLDLAQSAILAKGYSATSIEELIVGAGITKSGFFYHFDEKLDLAKAALRRDNERSIAGMRELFAAADAEQDNPLEAFCAGMISLVQSVTGASDGPLPGCLAASLSYQEAVFDDELRALVHAGLSERRDFVRDRLKALPGAPADLDIEDLADMASAVLQGSIILDRVQRNERVTLQHMTLYCAFLKTVFAGAGERAA